VCLVRFLGWQGGQQIITRNQHEDFEKGKKRKGDGRRPSSEGAGRSRELKEGKASGGKGREEKGRARGGGCRQAATYDKMVDIPHQPFNTS